MQQFAVFGQRNGMAQAAGQGADSQGLPLRFAHLCRIASHGRRGRVVFLNALHARREHYAEGEVGVAGRVGSAVFDGAWSFRIRACRLAP